MNVEEFNDLDVAAAAVTLRPALDVPRWGEEIIAARPFTDREALLEASRTAADPFTDEEIDQALSHHPRIGERAEGGSVEAGLSRAEQEAIDPQDAQLQQALRAGNLAYEERFGRVFLIRAAGRSPAQILEALEARLENDPVHERRVVAEQLREIAVLRLEGLVTA